MADGAAPGGPYRDALLVILSDHGQTPGGDHGGGTHDETDTVLIAVSPAKLRARQQQQQQQQVQQQREGGLGKEELDRLQVSLQSDAWAVSTTSSSGTGASSSSSVPLSESTCGSSIPQIDLTPTLALLMGVPIPYGNLGKVPAQLWRVLARGGDGDPNAAAAGGEGAGWEGGHTAALAANAAQVHRYLNRYATVAKLPGKRLARCNRLFQEAQQAAAAAEASSSGSSSGSSTSQEPAAAWLEFLEAAAALARAQFTQFHGGFIWLGVVAMAAVVALHLFLCW